MDDLFEKIIAREIPAAIVYEDDAIIAFLDINPVHKGHVLVVPKERFRNVFDAPEEILHQMISAAKKIAASLRETLNAEGVNLLMNNEPVAGQEVFHIHLHVIPRFQKDEALSLSHTATYEEGEIEAVAKKIRAAIS